MLAVGRALRSKPVLLDEPSLGLAPIVIDNMFETIRRLNPELGLTILIVEQNATLALEMCDWANVMKTGKSAWKAADQTCCTMRGFWTAIWEVRNKPACCRDFSKHFRPAKQFCGAAY